MRSAPFALALAALATLAALTALTALTAAPARGQCILANPSFELAGSGGAVFGGWNQFNSIGSVTTAYHGFKAARVSGPNYGGWDVSGYWQPFDCVAGQRWAVTGHVRHPSAKPLTGSCAAIVNLEWWNASAMISYESHTVATPASPTDAWIDFAFTSGAASSGVTKVRLLVAVLQSPTDPSPDVYYDQIEMHSTSSPTIDDKQWGDFPGGTTLSFGGLTWRVKGPGYYGPGGNLFSNSASNVWVDAAGLHLTIKKSGSSWYCTEVATQDALGYGDYVVTTAGRLDLLDPQCVLGLFLWMYGDCYDDGYLWWNAFDEIDIEYSRWGNPSSNIGQFVAQPYDYPGNITRYAMQFGDGEVVSHAMRWLPNRVVYRVWRGGPNDESPATTVYSWTYTGPHIPRPEQPRMHLNLWKLTGTPAANQEVVISNFKFVSAASLTGVADGSGGVPRPGLALGALRDPAPNPFNPLTTIAFDLAREGSVRLAIYDLSGRRVRLLASGDLPAGEHRTTWNGRDDADRQLPSGLYLVQLRGSGFADTKRVALIK